MPIDLSVTNKEIIERQMLEFRKGIDEVKSIGITARNFKDIWNTYNSILGKSEMMLIDLESNAMLAEEKLKELVDKAEKRGLPSEGNDYFYALMEAVTMIVLMKKDLDWRNFQFDIMDDWKKKLTQRVKESNEIEIDNIKLAAKIELAKEEHLLREQEIGKLKQEYEHKIEMQKLEDERKLREKELDIRKSELDKGIVLPPLLQPPLPPLQATQAVQKQDNADDLVSATKLKKPVKSVLDRSPDIKNMIRVLRPKLKINEALVSKFIDRIMARVEKIPNTWPNKKALTRSDFTPVSMGSAKFVDLNADEQNLIKVRLDRFFADFLKSRMVEGAVMTDDRDEENEEEENEENEDEDDSEEEEA